MGFEIWIAILVLTSALSVWIGFIWARKGAPERSELEAMAAELEEAKQASEVVQANVSEHFEQSAVLFGKLAADYREFLEHFSSSAQALGLSESRARELIEQGFQPLLTHAEDAVVAEAESAPAGEEEAEPLPVGEVTVELPDEASLTSEAEASETEVSETEVSGTEVSEKERRQA